MKFLLSLTIDTFAAFLSWLGRQGTRALAALVVIGIAVPSVGALLKPYVTEAIFVVLCIAFLRVDVSILKSYLHRPALVLTATVWASLGIPVLIGLCCGMLDLATQAPDLFLCLMLQAVAPPIMSGPAFAALMGLDATLVFAILIASTVLLPITAPLFAFVFVGPTLAISPLELGAKLLAILAGAAVVGIAMRRFFGLAAIERHEEKIDGLNIIVLFVFVAAIMGNVGARLVTFPINTIALGALAFVLFFAVLFLTALLFLPAGLERAFALAFITSQRNMGVMLAATGGVLPELVWLYFALAQFPIYLAPQLLQPLTRRIVDKGPNA